jgi:hypothetical protein
MRFFPRGRRERELDRLVRDTQDVARAALAATTAMRGEAAELRASIAALTDAVADLRDADEPVSTSRVVQLWLSVAGLAAVAMVVALVQRYFRAHVD